MATDISKLAVILAANAGGLTAGFNQGGAALAKFQAKAAGLSSRIGGAMNSAVTSLGASFMAMANPLVIAAAGVALLVSSFKAFMEAEKAVNQMEAALKSTGGAVGFTSEQLKGMAKDLQQLSTFDDEAIINAQTRLLAVTSLTGEEFKRAQVVSMDLATGMGTSLTDASTVLAKALAQPAKASKALRAANVFLTAQQKELIQSFVDAGDKAGAYNAIMDAVAVSHGGKAAAAVNTFEGKIKQATNAVNDMQEELVAGLAPALLEVAGAVKTLSEAMTEYAGVMKFVGIAISTSPLVLLPEILGDGRLSAEQAAAHFASIKPAVDTAAEATATMSDEMDKLGESIEKASEKFQEQIDTWGMDKRAAEISQLSAALAEMDRATDSLDVMLAQANASEERKALQAQIDKLKAMDAQLDALEAQKKSQDDLTKAVADEAAAHKKRWEDMRSAAKRITDDLMDPFERLAEKIDEINALHAAGLLTMQQATEARAKATVDLLSDGLAIKLDDIEQKAATRQPGNVAALERRFTAGFPAGDNPKPVLEQIKDLDKRALEAAKRTAKAVEQMAKDALGPIVSLQ